MHDHGGFHVIECFGYGGGVAEVEGENGGGGCASEARAGYGPGFAVEGCCDGAAEEAGGACYEGCLGGHVGEGVVVVGWRLRLGWRGYVGEVDAGVG